jgi:hypothetical protein
MDVLHEELRHVVLAHLSETNNTPEKALSAFAGRLTHHPVQLSVALQQIAGPMIII